MNSRAFTGRITSYNVCYTKLLREIRAAALFRGIGLFEDPDYPSAGTVLRISRLLAARQGGRHVVAIRPLYGSYNFV